MDYPEVPKTPPALPDDYDLNVYSGVLGKLIGVYAGRPFEQWTTEAITREWGEIRRYVNADRGVPLIVTDDDISGTFTFFRALLDHNSGAGLTSRQIGESWLNYIAEKRHILWWGGMGQSTEHTAFLRLKSGIDAPRSGSIALNGKAVAEEIGAQIFIDAWALVSPNQPEQAARFATEAARVSHDGEAVFGAVVLAVMESLAFVEKDMNTLVDRALAFIPGDSEIARLIHDVRSWYRTEPDWRKTCRRLVEHYGYNRYGTNCPMVTNHGVIHLALLYGGGDFEKSMMIVNTAGHDTDCNAGNVGCLLGIRNGVDTFRSGYDWRSPVNDRLFLPTADGLWGMMDAANLARRIAGVGRALHAGQLPGPALEKRRYDFPYPGSTHGFSPSGLSPREHHLVAVPGGLLVRILAEGVHCDAEINTFIPPEAFQSKGYGVYACPTLYPGQEMKLEMEALGDNRETIRVVLCLRTYGGGEAGSDLVSLEGPRVEMTPGERKMLQWKIPQTGGVPIAKAGIRLEGVAGAALVLKRMDWQGAPDTTFRLPDSIRSGWEQTNNPWQRSFCHDLDSFISRQGLSFELIKDRGRGLIHTGAEEWRDVFVEAEVRPFLAEEFGLAIRVQGLRRYYALVLTRSREMRLVKVCHSEETVLASVPYGWQERESVPLKLVARGTHLSGWIRGQPILAAQDPKGGFAFGGVGYSITEGRITSPSLRVGPV